MRILESRDPDELEKRAVPVPGIAHHRGPDSSGDHGGAFRTATTARGLDASSYFEASGIAALAGRSGGLCSFWLDGQVALLQTSNRPLVDDDALHPSLDSNATLFGDFVGAMEVHDPRRRERRLVVERALGTQKCVEGAVPQMRRVIDDFLRLHCDKGLATDEFALRLLAFTDSMLPGVLGLGRKPLTAYLEDGVFRAVAREFFEIASRALSNVDPAAITDSELIVEFTRDVLLENIDSIAESPPENLVRAQFSAWGIGFSREAVLALPAVRLKELGTIVVAAYDTSALSLLWALLYVADDPTLREDVTRAAKAGDERFLEAVALEAVRLGGSNPTALWRRLKGPTPVQHCGTTVVLPKGAMLWLDRRAANRDQAAFPCPHRFSPDNVEAIRRSDRETAQSLISRNRYEINSFSMVNTRRNPRKCPGRYFSIRVQAVALQRIFAAYDVQIVDFDLRLRTGRTMPSPRDPGTLCIRPRPPRHTKERPRS